MENYLLLLLLLLLETESGYAAQVGLDLRTLLPLSSESWEGRSMLPCLS